VLAGAHDELLSCEKATSPFPQRCWDRRVSRITPPQSAHDGHARRAWANHAIHRPTSCWPWGCASTTASRGPEHVCPERQVIHVDIDPAEIGKNVIAISGSWATSSRCCANSCRHRASPTLPLVCPIQSAAGVGDARYLERRCRRDVERALCHRPDPPKSQRQPGDGGERCANTRLGRPYFRHEQPSGSLRRAAGSMATACRPQWRQLCQAGGRGMAIVGDAASR